MICIFLKQWLKKKLPAVEAFYSINLSSTLTSKGYNFISLSHFYLTWFHNNNILSINIIIMTTTTIKGRSVSMLMITNESRLAEEWKFCRIRRLVLVVYQYIQKHLLHKKYSGFCKFVMNAQNERQFVFN